MKELLKNNRIGEYVDDSGKYKLQEPLEKDLCVSNRSIGINFDFDRSFNEVVNTYHQLLRRLA